ncbi:exodeoxyribonuclease VII large subunit [Bacillus timonensis]|nr:exodeoxyribonuclease VII large subunit [Bacillus timonensis]
MNEAKYLTVTALTKYIKRKFDFDPHLQDIWIKGEISNFKAHSRGHMYFTLKDSQARIQAVMFASSNKGLRFSPEDGMKVLIRGEISVYEQNGNYQVYVKEMQPDGIGNLYLAYEELKKKLQEEGLFSDSHKKKLPLYPQNIGVITSPTGAAIRDILTTIKRRYPIGKVTIIPALVQGSNAAPSISKAIKSANDLGFLDVLIVGRGGGSIEELWAFNEETVAREIFQSAVPIISAVGHETDYTIADFVADLRAPTPTGAAEMAVPHITELYERLTNRNNRLIRIMKDQTSYHSERLKSLQKSYAFRYPKKLYDQKEQQLDRLLERLDRQGKNNLQKKKEKFERVLLKLNHQRPSERLRAARENQQLLIKSLQKEMATVLRRKQYEFTAAISKLEALSPLKIMDRGYSLVYDQDNKLIKSISNIETGQSIMVKLQDGSLDCSVKNVEERTDYE